MTAADKFVPIKLVVMDVDGVLAKHIVYCGTTQEMKAFSPKDGFGITMLKKAGIKTAVLTGRISDPVAVRVEELKFDFYSYGHFNKEKALLEIMAQAGAASAETLYMGDDILDLVCRRHVGMFVAPADAPQRVLNSADFVTEARGGDSCVREMVEALLMAKGVLRDVEDSFMG